MSDANSPTVRGAVDLSGRTLFRFTGSDRLRYLNGQVTNDVAKASHEGAIYACVTNAKGKLEADVFVRAFGDEGYLVDGPAELREVLGARLERYIIADDVELDDVSDDFVIFHVIGKSASEVEEDCSGAWVGACSRFGVPGWDIVVPGGEADSVRSALAGRVGFVAEDELEALRIYNGVPVWGKELGSDLLPPEARLEDRAIDYEKGCYIGQEVISRIRSVGRVNRLLCGLSAVEGEFDAGDLLFSEGEDGRRADVGRVTSVADARGGRIGLGFVKRGFAEPGGRLCCGTGENSLFTEVEIREIPPPPCG